MDFKCGRCAFLLTDPVQDGLGYACQSCFPEGVPDLMGRTFMTTLPGACQECPWQGSLAEQGRHERSVCEQRQIQCDKCGEWCKARHHQLHIDDDCPNQEVQYPLCGHTGPRYASTTHVVKCVFGCGPIRCVDRDKHDCATTEGHREAHVTLKRKMTTLEETEAFLRSMLEQEKSRAPEALRRTKQLRELPSRFSVNTNMSKMTEYLNQGGSGETGLDILQKISAIFEHPHYSMNVTVLNVEELMQELVTQIVDVYCYDATKAPHVNEGFRIILACLRVTSSRISKQVGQILKGVTQNMVPELTNKVRAKFFEVVRAAPFPAQRAFFPKLIALLQSQTPLDLAGPALFQTLTFFLVNHKYMITDSFVPIAEVVKGRTYGETSAFLKKLVDASTAVLFYKTGLIDYVATHLTQQCYHGAALVTLRKISKLDATLLDEVHHLLPANF